MDPPVILCILYTFSILFRKVSLLGLWRKKLIVSDTVDSRVPKLASFTLPNQENKLYINKFYCKTHCTLHNVQLYSVQIKMYTVHLVEKSIKLQ